MTNYIVKIYHLKTTEDSIKQSHYYCDGVYIIKV